MGLRSRLLWLVQAILAASLTFGALFFFDLLRRDELVDFRTRNEKLLQAIGVTAAVFVAQNDLGGLDTLVAHLSDSLKGRDLIDLAVVDEQARVLAHTDTERFNTTLSDEIVAEAIDTDSTVWVHRGHELVIGVPAKSGIRWATVVARFSFERVEAQIARTRLFVASALFGLFLLLAAVQLVGLERLVIRPIRTLQQAVRRIAEGHLTTRVPPLKSRELGELSETVNRMAAALQAERDNLERAVAERTRELSEANARLERLAVTDGLTGLFNHRRFHEVLQAELLRALRHKRPMGVLMVDVDFFKKVNDTLGHPAGDELLRRLADVLSRDLRQTDLIARYGGEEFAVVLPETTKAEATQVAERMRVAVEAKLNGTDQWKQKITVSIGIATFPEDGTSGEALLEAADQAMYLAKRSGRNRVMTTKGPV